MLAPWPFWSAYAGTGFLLVLLAWLGGRRRKLSPKQMKAGAQPAACGSCGYDLTGLPGHICPECGSDLDLVGRLSPQFQRWAAVPVTSRLIVWTVMVAALGGAFFYVAHESTLPRRQSFELGSQWWIAADVPDDPLGRGYQPLSISLQASYTRRLWPSGYAVDPQEPVRPGDHTKWYKAQITFYHTSPPPVLPDQRLDYASIRSGQAMIHLRPTAGGKPRMLLQGESIRSSNAPVDGASETREAILEGLAQVGYAGEHGDAEALADALAGHLEQVLEDGNRRQTLPSGGPWGFRPAMLHGGTVEFEPWVVVSAAGFWLVVWLAGLPFVLRKRPISIRCDEAEATSGRSVGSAPAPAGA